MNSYILFSLAKSILYIFVYRYIKFLVVEKQWTTITTNFGYATGDKLPPRQHHGRFAWRPVAAKHATSTVPS